jgi:hypothetical protein
VYRVPEDSGCCSDLLIKNRVCPIYNHFKNYRILYASGFHYEGTLRAHHSIERRNPEMGTGKIMVLDSSLRWNDILGPGDFEAEFFGNWILFRI